MDGRGGIALAACLLAYLFIDFSVSLDASCGSFLSLVFPGMGVLAGWGRVRRLGGFFLFFLFFLCFLFEGSVDMRNRNMRNDGIYRGLYTYTARHVLETPFQKLMCRENKKNPSPPQPPGDFVSMFMLYAPPALYLESLLSGLNGSIGNTS